jgi:hypothetical protein
MIPATYVSADAVERADAYRFGYRSVCECPHEIGVPEANEKRGTWTWRHSTGFLRRSVTYCPSQFT